GGTVKYDPGRIPAFFIARGGWDRDNEGNSRPILAVEGRNTGPVITHPDRAVGGDGHAPGVNQIWIDVGGNARNVGLKIGPAVGVGARRSNTKRRRCQNEQRVRDQDANCSHKNFLSSSRFVFFLRWITPKVDESAMSEQGFSVTKLLP